MINYFPNDCNNIPYHNTTTTGNAIANNTQLPMSANIYNVSGSISMPTTIPINLINGYGYLPSQASTNLLDKPTVTTISSQGVVNTSNQPIETTTATTMFSAKNLAETALPLDLSSSPPLAKVDTVITSPHSSISRALSEMSKPIETLNTEANFLYIVNNESKTSPMSSVEQLSINSNVKCAQSRDNHCGHFQHTSMAFDNRQYVGTDKSNLMARDTTINTTANKETETVANESAMLLNASINNSVEGSDGVYFDATSSTTTNTTANNNSNNNNNYEINNNNNFILATAVDNLNTVVDPLNLPTSGMTHCLIKFNRLYGVYHVPPELRPCLHVGDLAVCESSHGENTGVVLCDLSAHIPHIWERRKHKLKKCAHDPLWLTTDANPYSKLGIPLYSVPAISGLAYDDKMYRLPRVRRRGLNKDKKKVYFSHRRNTEALKMVRQFLLERGLSSLIVVDDVNYQVDFAKTTVFLQGKRDECVCTDDQFERLASLLLGPLRTEKIEFRFVYELSEECHITRYLIGRHLNHTINKALQNNVSERVLRTNTRGTEQYSTGSSEMLAGNTEQVGNSHATIIPQLQQRTNNIVLPITENIQFLSAAELSRLVSCSVNGNNIISSISCQNDATVPANLVLHSSETVSSPVLNGKSSLPQTVLLPQEQLTAPVTTINNFISPAGFMSGTPSTLPVVTTLHPPAITNYEIGQTHKLCHLPDTNTLHNLCTLQPATIVTNGSNVTATYKTCNNVNINTNFDTNDANINVSNVNNNNNNTNNTVMPTMVYLLSPTQSAQMASQMSQTNTLATNATVLNTNTVQLQSIPQTIPNCNFDQIQQPILVQYSLLPVSAQPNCITEFCNSETELTKPPHLSAQQQYSQQIVTEPYTQNMTTTRYYPPQEKHYSKGEIQK